MGGKTTILRWILLHLRQVIVLVVYLFNMACIPLLLPQEDPKEYHHLKEYLKEVLWREGERYLLKMLIQ